MILHVNPITYTNFNYMNKEIFYIQIWNLVIQLKKINIKKKKKLEHPVCTHESLCFKRLLRLKVKHSKVKKSQICIYV